MLQTSTAGRIVIFQVNSFREFVSLSKVELGVCRLQGTETKNSATPALNLTTLCLQ